MSVSDFGIKYIYTDSIVGLCFHHLRHETRGRWRVFVHLKLVVVCWTLLKLWWTYRSAFSWWMLLQHWWNILTNGRALKFTATTGLSAGPMGELYNFIAIRAMSAGPMRWLCTFIAFRSLSDGPMGELYNFIAIRAMSAGPIRWLCNFIAFS